MTHLNLCFIDASGFRSAPEKDRAEKDGWGPIPFKEIVMAGLFLRERYTAAPSIDELGVGVEHMAEEAGAYVREHHPHRGGVSVGALVTAALAQGFLILQTISCDEYESGFYILVKSGSPPSPDDEP